MFAPGLRYRPEYAAGAVDQQLFGTGNLLRCEAHHELLCNYFKNLMQRRCAEARRGIEPVLALSRAPVTLFEGECGRGVDEGLFFCAMARGSRRRARRRAYCSA